MNVKIHFLLFVSILLFTMNGYAQEKDPVVMSINGKEITKSEFLQVYLKNNEDPKYDKESLDEYIELFKKFKLKVAEAEALGYDTIPALIKELNGYTEQLAQPYLVDREKVDQLVEEAYNRMKYEIRASHILVSLSPNASPEDTLAAYNRALALKKEIENGKDFGEVASGKDGSDDPTAKENKGDLGYFTAFQMVYPFESAAYNLEIGEVSMPVRTSFGYHLVKVFDRRDARGTISTAHIMVATSKNATATENENAKKKINEIYERLNNGESFSKLAQLYSDDQGSKTRGGKIPAFGTGTNQRMVPEFEDAAFALKNDNDYSQPFRTNYGYHIVQRISFSPLASFDELKADIKQKINRSDRAQQSERAFIHKLKEENKIVDKGSKRLNWFYENIDSTVFTKNWSTPSLKRNKWMFKYQGVKYDMQAFLNYIADAKRSTPKSIPTFINQNYEQWQNELILADEKSRLQSKYPAYKALLQEYHDGILLYEIMKDKVWDKAIKDTTGLVAYFEENIENYQWPERIQAEIYSSDKKEMLLEAQLFSEIDTLQMNDILAKVNTDSQLNLTAEQGKFVSSNHPALTGRKLKPEKNEIFQKEGKYYLVIVKEIIPEGPKSIDEARGAVIQDYQEYLETQWLDELNQKHIVEINEDVLYKIGE